MTFLVQCSTNELYSDVHMYYSLSKYFIYTATVTIKGNLFSMTKICQNSSKKNLSSDSDENKKKKVTSSSTCGGP